MAGPLASRTSCLMAKVLVVVHSMVDYTVVLTSAVGCFFEKLLLKL
jgi:hypothetical protein